MTEPNRANAPKARRPVTGIRPPVASRPSVAHPQLRLGVGLDDCAAIKSPDSAGDT
ncbi:MAG: hypothetical protein MUQ10_07150 [Anaerolineae bacterium]|nr:hypothetical protein [Anaerolineae bacterium]